MRSEYLFIFFYFFYFSSIIYFCGGGDDGTRSHLSDMTGRPLARQNCCFLSCSANSRVRVVTRMHNAIICTLYTNTRTSSTTSSYIIILYNIVKLIQHTHARIHRQQPRHILFAAAVFRHSGANYGRSNTLQYIHKHSLCVESIVNLHKIKINK